MYYPHTAELKLVKFSAAVSLFLLKLVFFNIYMPVCPVFLSALSVPVLTSIDYAFHLVLNGPLSSVCSKTKRMLNGQWSMGGNSYIYMSFVILALPPLHHRKGFYLTAKRVHIPDRYTGLQEISSTQTLTLVISGMPKQQRVRHVNMQ